ncbi:MauE/DoxX family redox-associated membrane protein [Ideonella sp. A 288]|uniref:MauE/DoxX family redox-associated membrane protein n=1 Tax=Ideonella sp. A 288 TaxID=1962181 RepID=UPI001303AFA4|nr:MauE/DoxX family redox-associated membrane protein [Ideonella sp. A 288]
MSVDPLVLLIAAGCIAALLLHAAVAKLGDRALFHQHLAAYGAPEPLQPALVWAIPLAEAAAALGLVTPWRSVAAVLAAALLLSYGVAMAWHLRRGHRLDCGCGGEPLALSPWLVARNAVLAAVALLAALPPDDRAVGVADFAVAAAAVAVAALIYAAFHQLLRQQPARKTSSSSRSAA